MSSLGMLPLDMCNLAIQEKGPRGPSILREWYLLTKHAHVHAKLISHYTCTYYELRQETLSVFHSL